MDSVETARQLWRRKPWIALVLIVAVLGSLLVSYRVSVFPPGLHKRTLQVGAASGQILVDTPQSTLVSGASAEQFDTLAARARVYGEYLSTLQARARIASLAGVPEQSITTSGPFSPESGQVSYENQTSASRGNEILKEGAQNRLVFTAQEGVPIISVDAQAATAATAVRLAHASFIALREYVGGLENGDPRNKGVVVRELGAPQGGTIGGSNGKLLMILAFFVIAGLGCALILIAPGLAQRWRSLDAEEREAARAAVGSPGSDREPEPEPQRETEHHGTPVNGKSANGGAAEAHAAVTNGDAEAEPQPAVNGTSARGRAEAEEHAAVNGTSANGRAADPPDEKPARARTKRARTPR